MKPLAQRTDDLRQSDIRAITFAVNAVDGINLGQGICDLPVPKPLRAGAIDAIEEDGTAIYTAYNGVRALRERIAEKAASFNKLPVRGNGDVMVSAGSTGAFVAAVLTLCNPGDEVILFEPFYGYHTGILHLLGVTPVSVPLAQPNWQVDLDAVEAAVTERTKAVLVCTPANPTGKVWTTEELKGLLQLIERHDLYAVTDEIYEYMTYDGAKHVSLGSLPGAYQRTVTISGFSKTFNMTGWRLGYAVVPPPVIEKMGLVNDLTTICAPAPLQHGMARALPLDEIYFREMADAYTQRRRLMCETLDACGFELTWPAGAYYAFASFEKLANERTGFNDDREAAQTLIDTTGVASVPGNSFFSDPKQGRHFLRFCFAKEMDVLEEACGRLREALG